MTYSITPEEFERPAPARAESGRVESARVELAIACVNCGYSLEGLAVDGACPECAEAVSRSVRGDLLESLPLQKLKALDRGTLLVKAGAIASIPGFGLAWLPLAFFAASPVRATGAWAIALYALVALIIIGLGLLVAGWWLITGMSTGLIGRWTGERALALAVRAAGVIVAGLVGALLSTGFLIPVTALSPVIYQLATAGAALLIPLSTLAMMMLSGWYLSRAGKRARFRNDEGVIQLQTLLVIASGGIVGITALLLMMTPAFSMCLIVVLAVMLVILLFAHGRSVGGLRVAVRKAVGERGEG